jgi:hypothetical protein
MTPDDVLESHRTMLTDIGETVTVRRYAGRGASRAVSAEADALGRVLGYQPKDIAGAIQQGDRRVILLNDPTAAVAPGKVSVSDLLPLTNLDVVVVRGAEVQIIGVDDSTRRIGGVLVALELQVRG